MKLHILSCLLVLCGGLHCAAAQTNEPVNLTPHPDRCKCRPKAAACACLRRGPSVAHGTCLTACALKPSGWLKA